MATKIFNTSSSKKLASRADKDAIMQLKELMAEGKELGKAIGYKSEEEVAAEITAERRKTRLWKPSDFRK